MARERLTFRQRDLRAAITAAHEAGLTVSGFTISRDGEIKIILTTPELDTKSPGSTKNPWDKYYENPPKLRKGV